MNVRELKRLLDQYPDDLRVVVDGYEEGYDDVTPGNVYVRRLRLNAGQYRWEGRHFDAEENGNEGAAVEDALIIHRTSRC